MPELFLRWGSSSEERCLSPLEASEKGTVPLEAKESAEWQETATASEKAPAGDSPPT